MIIIVGFIPKSITDQLQYGTQRPFFNKNPNCFLVTTSYNRYRGSPVIYTLPPGAWPEGGAGWSRHLTYDSK